MFIAIRCRYGAAFNSSNVLRVIRNSASNNTVLYIASSNNVFIVIRNSASNKTVFIGIRNSASKNNI